MRRRIPSWSGEEISPLERHLPLPETLHIPVAAAVNRCEVKPLVRTGQWVSAGEPMAQGPALVIHAPRRGEIVSSDENEIVIRCVAEPEKENQESPALAVSPPSRDELPDFVREMGLVGMGGSQFPASIKLKAATRIHTLVVNAVECEPGIQIDEALLLHEPESVIAGIYALVSALQIERTTVAVKVTSRPHAEGFAATCKADLLLMPNRYPGGAEKLIVSRLSGSMPPAGVLPVQMGYLVTSVTTLWALGRRLRFGEPSILRPLTLCSPPAPPRNLLVFVGTLAGELLTSCGIPFNPKTHLLITGGLMMGTGADLDTPILKGTNALYMTALNPRLLRAERPCILCGACFDSCPLGLHPSGMAERLREKRTSSALRAQLDECFLCGVCSAVCPAEIPLVQNFREAKRRTPR